MKFFVFLIASCLLFNSSYAQGSVKAEDDTLKNQLPALERYEVRITVCSSFNDVIKITDPDDSVFQVSCIKKPDFVNFAWNGSDSITFYGHFWGAEEYETEIKLQVTDFKDTIVYDLGIGYHHPIMLVEVYADTCYVGKEYFGRFFATARVPAYINTKGFPDFLELEKIKDIGSIEIIARGMPKKTDIGTYPIYYELEGCKGLTYQLNTITVLETLENKIDNFFDFDVNKYCSFNNDEIVFEDSNDIEYQIFNMNGKEIKAGKSKKVISINDLKTGIYVLKTNLITVKFFRK